MTPRITYISWAESCSRSDHTARELGGRSHMIYVPWLGSRASTIIVKYVIQWIRTAAILSSERPDIIFVMTPPLFAALPAFWYAWWHRKAVILDVHSAALLHPRWRRFQWLQYTLCRRAVTSLVHTEEIGRIISAAGAHTTLVPDVPIVYDDPPPFPKPVGWTVAAVCSFNYDEPVAAILEAARLLPDTTFLVTGNPRYLDPSLATALPSNVRLTGFLDAAAYGALLRDADCVLALTTRDHTMLRGAYEAIYQGTPVIVSNWDLLRDAFPEGAAHVDNTSVGIAEAVRRMQSDPQQYRQAARRLRKAKLARWSRTRAAILAGAGISAAAASHSVGGTSA